MFLTCGGIQYIPDCGEIYPCCVRRIPDISLTVLIYIPTILSYIYLTVAKYIHGSGGIYVSLTVAEYSICIPDCGAIYVSLTMAQNICIPDCGGIYVSLTVVENMYP